MRSKFSLVFFSVLSICFAYSCQDEKGTQTPINEGDPISAQVSNVNNCKSGVKSFELDAVVNIYPISDRFDYSGKSNFTKYTPDATGKYKMNLEDGNYYFEAINKQGMEIINGTFEIPEDLFPTGNLILSRVYSQGFVQERLSDGSFGSYIANAEITYIHEITGKTYVTTSDAGGGHCIDLNPGRYQVIVKHKDYNTYDTENGFNVFVLGDTNHTSHFFLTKK